MRVRIIVPEPEAVDSGQGGPVRSDLHGLGGGLRVGVDHTPLPRTGDGGVDAGQVTAIVIVDVVGYH